MPVRTFTLLLLALVLAPNQAAGIPAFARRYRVSCSQCHSVVPALNDFGNTFASNGFRFAPGTVGPGTIETGDESLTLLEKLPLAVRLDAYLQGFTNGSFKSDLQTPYNLKILSGGPISQSISYYFYYFLSERGDVGGIEDAFIYFNDIAGAEIDAAVGQFQTSDPMFKRELRLEFEDYAIYRAQLGESRIDLTYDRGVAVTGALGDFTATGIVVNGNGKGPAGPDRQFDVDPGKNGLFHVTGDVLPWLRLGAFGFGGSEEADSRRNEVWMAGLDGTVTLGAFELNGQYIHREDSDPTFSPTVGRVTTDGGFAEALVRPQGSRWYGFALYNIVDAGEPLLAVRLGGPDFVEQYQTFSLGVGNQLRRNFRMSLEGTWDIEQRATRISLGIVTAF